MSRVLTIVIGGLAIVALAVLGTSIYGQYLLMASDDVGDSQRFVLLPGIAISAGVLIAALTFLREKARADLESSRHTSEVLLKNASEGFRTVVELLSDQNNSRITWLRAARTLLQARKMGEKINSEEYRIAYKLQEERTRNELYMVLTLSDEQTMARQPLPPQFFYGIDDWRSCATLDEAALQASDSATAYRVTIDSVPPRPGLRPIATKSVVAIFEFIEYPKDYDDPLDVVVDWDTNWDRSLGIDQGARRYVAHAKQKIAVGGKLHDLSSEKGVQDDVETKSS